MLPRESLAPDEDKLLESIVCCLEVCTQPVTAYNKPWSTNDDKIRIKPWSASVFRVLDHAIHMALKVSRARCIAESILL